MSSWYGDAGGSKNIMIRALGMITLAALSGPAWGPFRGPLGALSEQSVEPSKIQIKPPEGPKEAPKGPQELSTTEGSVGT